MYKDLYLDIIKGQYMNPHCIDSDLNLFVDPILPIVIYKEFKINSEYRHFTE